jgi:hypothetical protein
MYEALPAFIDAIQAENDVRAIQKLLLDTLGEVLGADNVLIVSPGYFAGVVHNSWRSVKPQDDEAIRLLRKQSDYTNHPSPLISVQTLSPNLILLLRRKTSLTLDERTLLRIVAQITSNRIDALMVLEQRKRLSLKMGDDLGKYLSATLKILQNSHHTAIQQLNRGLDYLDRVKTIYRLQEDAKFFHQRNARISKIVELLHRELTRLQYPSVETEIWRGVEEITLKIDHHSFRLALTELILDLDRLAEQAKTRRTQAKIKINHSQLIPNHMEFVVQHAGLSGLRATPIVAEWFYIHKNYLVDHPTGGAYLLQKVVELHNGDLDVQIDEAAGVTVTIYLPLAHP